MKIKCPIVSGFGIATETLSLQKKFFIEAGIPKEVLEMGSINIDTSPHVLEVKHPDIVLRGIEWRKDFVEDFSFLRVRIIFEGENYSGFVYKPARTNNPKTITELIALPIPGIAYGKDIEIEFDDQSVLLK